MKVGEAGEDRIAESRTECLLLFGKRKKFRYSKERGTRRIPVRGTRNSK